MTHHRGGMRHHSLHSGRSNLFYLYERPICYCNNIPCDCPLDVGALDSGKLVRTNPIPPGRYWVDVFGDNIPLADRWFKAMSGLGVRVIATQSFIPTPAEILNSGEFGAEAIKKKIRNWYLFEYSLVGGVPISWDQETFGFLSVAGPEVNSSEDTVQRPELPLDPLDELETFAQSIGSMVGITSKAGAIALTAGIFIGAGYALLEFLKKPKRKK